MKSFSNRECNLRTPIGFAAAVYNFSFAEGKDSSAKSHETNSLRHRDHRSGFCLS